MTAACGSSSVGLLLPTAMRDNNIVDLKLLMLFIRLRQALLADNSNSKRLSAAGSSLKCMTELVLSSKLCRQPQSTPSTLSNSDMTVDNCVHF